MAMRRIEVSRTRLMRVTRGLVLAILVAMVDQVAKSWLLDRMAHLPRGQTAITVTSFFNIVLAWNRGVSFGLFNNAEALNGFIFSIIAAAVVSALILWLIRAHGDLIAVAIGFVIGGAVGNVIDRMQRGAVVDFLDFHLSDVHFWAFNLADAAITIGVALMLIDSLLGRREQHY
jgi:signal peptidase II